MPSFRTKEKDENNNLAYKGVCNPITKEFWEKINDAVLAAYQQVKEQTM